MRRRVRAPAKVPRSAYTATVANTVSACIFTLSQKEKPRTNGQGASGGGDTKEYSVGETDQGGTWCLHYIKKKGILQDSLKRPQT